MEINTDININIIFGNDIFDFNNNNNKFIKIKLNYEHTLVKKGGRDTNNSPVGNILTDDNDKYLVRIDRFQELNNADIIIDYSIPNIHNIKESNLFEYFCDKYIYIYIT